MLEYQADGFSISIADGLKLFLQSASSGVLDIVDKSYKWPDAQPVTILGGLVGGAIGFLVNCRLRKENHSD